MPTSKKRKAARLALLVEKPPRNIDISELNDVRYTQTHIHTQFSNNSLHMDVFDTYFAIKYDLIPIEELPPIRIYEYGGHLWSIDNRRLWIMHEYGSFYYEGPYTKDHSESRFMEFESKYSSLHGTSGKQIQFHSDDPGSCCVDAWNLDTLDKHEITDHLKLTVDEFHFLTECPVHRLTSCKCLKAVPNKTSTTSLDQALSKRCQLIRKLVKDADLVLSRSKKELLNRFDKQNDEETFEELFRRCLFGNLID
jgi:hypothetical protein